MSDTSETEPWSSCPREQDWEDGDDAATGRARCVKIQQVEHVTPEFVKKRPIRLTVTKCDNDLMDKVMLNYIIVKKILSNLSWQDKLRCERVCTTWSSAIRTLRKEQLCPTDFFINNKRSLECWAAFYQSGTFCNNPMVVMTFVNASGFRMSCQCKQIKPTPCTKKCNNNKHCLIDVVHKFTCAPMNCMNILRADYTVYIPLPGSLTYEHTITNLKHHPLIGGIYIPMISDVKYHTINLKHNGNMQLDFYDMVNEIAKDRIFKGLLVYVTDKFLLRAIDIISFLDYFKEIQPDVPFALGGCIIEDTICDQTDINGVVEAVDKGSFFISENLMTIGLFTVPKEDPIKDYNFEMYSVVLESFDWQKDKILLAITEFSKRVPRFEYSVALKLSCVGRDQKHKWEQECFRKVFPYTRIVGCFGNGEIGINHPRKPRVESFNLNLNTAKRHKLDTEATHGVIRSYCTVFVYIGWGKTI